MFAGGRGGGAVYQISSEGCRDAPPPGLDKTPLGGRMSRGQTQHRIAYKEKGSLTWHEEEEEEG